MSLHKHSGRALPALCAAVVALFVFSFGRSGAVSIRVPLSELSAGSQVIAQGRVERVESAWTANGIIESTVYLRLAQAHRGALSEGALIPVKARGGTVDGLTMRSSDEATFAVGEEVYLFLAGPERGGYRVVAGSQGKFAMAGGRAVNRETGRSLAPAEMEKGAREDIWPEEAASSLDIAGAAAPDNYAFNNVKWFGPNPMEEPYVINVNTGDAAPNGGANAFVNAIVAGGNAWSNAGAVFRFSYGGGSSVTTIGYDGKNSVHWEDMGTSTTLAEATWWFTERGNVDQIVEVDIRFNDYYIWDATGKPASNEQDLQSVATHELGHWLSLGHDTDANAVMHYSYRSGSLKRGLHSNDVAGLRAIYGTASTPVPPTATRTATQTRTATPTRTRTPHPTLAPWQIKSRSYLPLLLK